jgi:DNA-binding transcriptional ArsR family regulator
MDPARHAVLLPWMARVRPALSRIDWAPLSSLAVVSRGSIPDFLAPPPVTPLPQLADELAALKRVSEQVVRTEIEIAFPKGVPRDLHQALREPAVFLTRITSLIEEFWRRAIAPEWQLVRSRLESEVLFRARALALGGLDELFQGIHRDVRFEHGQLTVQTDSYWDGAQRRAGILLVPSIFSWPDVFLCVRPPWQPTINYPARGVADLWSDTSRSNREALGLVVGRSCARVIARLEQPQTTIEIATALKLSSAAASEQVTKLWRAGILERTRVGRRVFYSLNRKGETILTAFQK